MGEKSAESEQSDIGAELARLREGMALIDQLRELFGRMEDDGERERGWNYLRDRFPEFKGADKPSHFEGLIDE